MVSHAPLSTVCCHSANGVVRARAGTSFRTSPTVTAARRSGTWVLKSGTGWHEIRIPTIAASEPRRAYSWVAETLTGQVGIPVIASNRINTPEVTEAILA